MATKQLAKQLGLIRRHSVTSASDVNHRKRKSNQLFTYLIVIDFESTCWNDGKNHYTQEIIEFPAVLLNTSDGQIESEFHTYVQPQEHPILSAFCTELTGIQQSQVDVGVPLMICLSQFSRWIRKLQQEKNILFISDASKPSDPETNACAFVTWSDWDLGVCLQYECKRKQLRKPDILNCWIDLRATYKQFYNRKPKGLNGALQDLGIEFSGREHSGLDDARNTAHLAWRMISDGCVMRITKSLNRVPPKRNSLITSPAVIHKECSAPGKKDNSEITNESSASTVSRQTLEVQSKQDILENSKNKTNVKEVQMKSHPVLGASINKAYQSKESSPETNAKNNKLCIQSLVSPKTVLNGLSTPLGFGVHKPGYCTSGNMKNRIITGKLTSTPNDTHSTTSSNLVLISTTVTSVNNISDIELSSVSDSEAMLTDWEEAAIIPESDDEKNKYSIDLPKSSSSNMSDVALLPEEYYPLSCASFKDPEPNTVKPLSVIYKSPNTTIYDVGGITKPSSGSATFKMPTAKPNTFELSSVSKANTTIPNETLPSKRSTSHQNVLKRKPSSTSLILPPIKQSSTVYQDKPSSLDGSLLVPRSSSFSLVSPAALRSSVNQNQSLQVMKTKKITPPLCNCGRRTKKLTVSNAGPNHGKTFYCCPVGNRNGENRKGCRYFKWEHTLFRERSLATSPCLSTSRVSFTSSGTSFLSTGTFGLSESRSLGLRPSMRT